MSRMAMMKPPPTLDTCLFGPSGNPLPIQSSSTSIKSKNEMTKMTATSGSTSSTNSELRNGHANEENRSNHSKEDRNQATNEDEKIINGTSILSENNKDIIDSEQHTHLVRTSSSTHIVNDETTITATTDIEEDNPSLEVSTQLPLSSSKSTTTTTTSEEGKEEATTETTNDETAKNNKEKMKNLATPPPTPIKGAPPQKPRKSSSPKDLLSAISGTAKQSKTNHLSGKRQSTHTRPSSSNNNNNNNKSKSTHNKPTKQKSHQINLQELRRLTSQGVPDECTRRALSWRILLGYLPADTSQWQEVADKERLLYRNLVEELLVLPTGYSLEEEGEALRGIRRGASQDMEEDVSSEDSEDGEEDDNELKDEEGINVSEVIDNEGNTTETIAMEKDTETQEDNPNDAATNHTNDSENETSSEATPKDEAPTPKEEEIVTPKASAKASPISISLDDIKSPTKTPTTSNKSNTTAPNNKQQETQKTSPYDKEVKGGMADYIPDNVRQEWEKTSPTNAHTPTSMLKSLQDDLSSQCSNRLKAWNKLRSSIGMNMVDGIPDSSDGHPGQVKSINGINNETMDRLKSDVSTISVSSANSNSTNSATVNSIQHIENFKLLDEIRKDVVRTHPDLSFFLEEQDDLGIRRYAAMERILFVWAKLNKGVRYVQGMNEIVGTMYYVLATDSNKEWSCEAEADSYFLFNILMVEMRDIFVPDLDEADTGIQGRMANMISLLSLHDPEVRCHLDDCGIDPAFYSIRWLTTLLSREFTLPDTIRLWDSMFASTHKDNFMRYACVTMVMLIRDKLLRGDFGTCLRLLQDYPPMNVDQLLETSRALWIYESQVTLACHKGGISLSQALTTIAPPPAVSMAYGLNGGMALDEVNRLRNKQEESNKSGGGSMKKGSKSKKVGNSSRDAKGYYVSDSMSSLGSIASSATSGRFFGFFGGSGRKKNTTS